MRETRTKVLHLDLNEVHTYLLDPIHPTDDQRDLCT